MRACVCVCVVMKNLTKTVKWIQNEHFILDESGDESNQYVEEKKNRFPSLL